MSMTLRDLRERAGKVLAQQRSILTDNPNELSAEDRSRYERLDREYLAITSAMSAHQAGDFRAVDALRGVMTPGHEPSADTQRGEVRRLIDDFVTRGREGAVELERRALGLSSDTVPVGFADFLTVYERTASPMLDNRIVTIVDHPQGRGSTRYPRLTADAAHGGTVTLEAGGINELDPTLSSVVLAPFAYKVITLFSNELDMDAGLDVEGYIAASAARELGLDAGAHLTTGTDTTQPNGIVTAATIGGTAAGTASGTSLDTFVSPADLLDLWYGLPGPHRSNPRSGFMVSSTMAAKVAKFRDSEGRWLSDFDIDGQLRFRGIPVYENPAMAAVASATKSVVAGDFSRYVVQRAPVRVDVSRDYKFGTDQVAVRVVERLDADLLDAAGVRSLVSANT